MIIILFNNACLKYPTCNNSCPLKCGFESSAYRCFFDCGDNNMSFSENVFYERGKPIPQILENINHTCCDDDIYCSKCSWGTPSGKCKIFINLRERVKDE
jgi:hypothetical protein